MESITSKFKHINFELSLQAYAESILVNRLRFNERKSHLNSFDFVLANQKSYKYVIGLHFFPNEKTFFWHSWVELDDEVIDVSYIELNKDNFKFENNVIKIKPGFDVSKITDIYFPILILTYDEIFNLIKEKLEVAKMNVLSFIIHKKDLKRIKEDIIFQVCSKAIIMYCENYKSILEASGFKLQDELIRF